MRSCVRVMQSLVVAMLARAGAMQIFYETERCLVHHLAAGLVCCSAMCVCVCGTPVPKDLALGIQDAG